MEDGTPYCRNVKGLIEDWFNLKYKADDFRLFIDFGKGSFKCVLLHNDGLIKGIPLLYSTKMNENQEDVDWYHDCSKSKKYSSKFISCPNCICFYRP